MSRWTESVRRLDSWDAVQRHVRNFVSMSGRDVLSLLSETLSEWSKDKCPRLGASLAYYTVLSLAPLLVVVIAVAGLALGKEAAQGEIVGQIRGLVGEQGAAAVQTTIASAATPATGIMASILGLLTLFFGASAVVGELRDAMNTIWEVPEDRSQSGLRGVVTMIRERFLSFAMVLGIGFLLLVSLAINAALSAFGTFLSGWLPAPELLLQLLNFLVSLAVSAALFAMIFKFLPDVEIAWSDVVVGAAATALLFSLGRLLIGLYLGKSALSSAYGAAGSLVILLVWVYYSAQVFFFGAEFTQVYANRYGSRVEARRRAGPPDSQAPVPPSPARA